MKESLSRTKYLSMLGLLAAMEIVLTLTPLGFIPLGVTKATTLHIPVILGGVLMGPLAGGILGGVFGLLSVITNTFQPTITSFVFTPFYSLTPEYSGNLWSLVIAILPRVLIGVFSAWVFRLLRRGYGRVPRRGNRRRDYEYRPCNGRHLPLFRRELRRRQGDRADRAARRDHGRHRAQRRA